ncbi:diaminopimelate dehydrogenase [Alkalibacterium kapii]|uniref:Meso-diaminopimelate D-dehydrogenase n=1 Tax=Alkalibacterium kapii TaxID=426704 RepID=A0A511AV92_9LACT|nr:diaminopimelate dehydrogenase [Alkalibacterium kapii]GEK91582.1 diaminopimelate dehydrogenase [Alkalibacterium kapii]
MKKTRIGIVGYGNLGKGVEAGLKHSPDLELTGIFTRRQPDQLETLSPAYSIDKLIDFKNSIDVLILCGGSQKDIPLQAPELAQTFNTVDTYDNHNEIPVHFERLDKVAKENKTVAVLSTGWDPGLFSLNRLIAEAIMPKGETYTFWGPGLSQGHSDAVRRVKGVKNAAQYTVPKKERVDKVKDKQPIHYNKKEAHKRVVYLVLEEGADESKVKEAIISMPDYFQGYETKITILDQDTLDKDHQGMPHGGTVIRQGKTTDENTAIYQFGLDLDSNPEFTAAVTIAYARAAARLAKERQYGAKTVFDIAPGYLSPESPEDLRRKLL